MAEAGRKDVYRELPVRGKDRTPAGVTVKDACSHCRDACVRQRARIQGKGEGSPRKLSCLG